MDSRIQVDQTRLTEELEHLATFSDAPAPAVTRVLYTEQDLKARAWFKELCREAGLELREDALGNVYARWQGAEPGLSAVATGSHIDAIPFSGRYDGTVGVLGGLEAIRALQRSGFTPRRSVELILFTSEEPTRFGMGCLGSRAMAGTLSPDDLHRLKDEDGCSLDAVRCKAGFTGRLEDVRLSEGVYRAFVELHIEQGPLLEQKGLNIGVVTAIAAPATLHLTLKGQGGHAGAVLMPERCDALLAGAEIALAVEEAAYTSGSVDTVATVGIFDVHPRAVNSIVSRVVMTVDARDIDLARRDHTVEKIRKAVQDISSGRSVGAELTVVNADPPATCAPEVVRAVEAAAKGLGLSSLPMVSRAYHDTLFMARLCPVGMIFTPCRDGVSHRPDEYVEPEAIQNGVQTLARTLARLAE